MVLGTRHDDFSLLSPTYTARRGVRCDASFILNEAVAFLLERNLQPYNFLKDGTTQPMVFAWMPAIAIYFNDPDGHVLEFIAILEGKAKPELGVISYEEWMHNKDND